ncbi:MAG: glycosyltransferase family 4 protein [Paraglaciecola sp.]|nr:glycosyltransferase family 4 protein [Paraglaciecola sp.]
MKVLQKRFLLVAGYPDSLLNFRGPFLRALLAEGLDVHVAAPDLPEDSPIRHKLENLGVQVHEVILKRTGVNPLIDLITMVQLWWLMRSIKPDFTLGYTIKPVIYGSLAAWFAAVPHRYAMITGLGYAFQGENGDRLWLKRIVASLYSAALANTHKVFFQNPDDEALFYQQNILRQIEQKSVVVNGSGIDVDSFKLVTLPEKPCFLLIARLIGDKGVREYVKSASIVKNSHPEASFGLVGWIDDNPDSISENELAEWIDFGVIEFYGRLADVKPAIANCSVYVLPSYREGTPRTVLEAMAMGRPIITTDAPGCRETVTDGDNGYLVPVKSVEDLALAMQKFIKNPDLIKAMGKQSRQIAEEKYDVNKVNQQMLHEMGVI